LQREKKTERKRERRVGEENDGREQQVGYVEGGASWVCCQRSKLGLLREEQVGFVCPPHTIGLVALHPQSAHPLDDAQQFESKTNTHT